MCRLIYKKIRLYIYKVGGKKAVGDADVNI